MIISSRVCISALFAWLALNGLAKANCPPTEGVQITVEVSSVPVETVFDTSLDQLAQLAQASGRQVHMPLRAVYSSRILYGANIKTQVKRISTGGMCARARSIDVRISVEERKVHAARELRENSCLLSAATNHALAHAHYQEASLSAARDRIASSLAARMREPLPTAVGATEAERALSRIVSAQIDTDLANIDAEKTEAARKIDAPEALASLEAACSTEQSKSVNERT